MLTAGAVVQCKQRKDYRCIKGSNHPARGATFFSKEGKERYIQPLPSLERECRPQRLGDLIMRPQPQKNKKQKLAIRRRKCTFGGACHI